MYCVFISGLKFNRGEKELGKELAYKNNDLFTPHLLYLLTDMPSQIARNLQSAFDECYGESATPVPQVGWGEFKQADFVSKGLSGLNQRKNRKQWLGELVQRGIKLPANCFI